MIDIDYISNYDIDIIRKIEVNKLNKKNILTKLILKNPNIKEELINTLNNNSVLICLTRKKIIYAINIFEYNKKQKELELVRTIVTDEVNEKDIEEFNKASKNISINLLPIEEFNIFEKNISQKQTIITDKKLTIQTKIILPVILGLVFGIIFDHFLLGLLTGTILGLSIYILNIKKIATSSQETKDNSKKNN